MLPGFSEYKIDPNQSISQLSIQEIKESYRNITPILTADTNCASVAAPLHWFVNSDDFIKYIAENNVLAGLLPIYKKELTKKVKAINKVAKLYPSYEKFYEDIILGMIDYYFSVDDEEEQDELTFFIRGLIVNMIAMSRFVAFIEKTSDSELNNPILGLSKEEMADMIQKNSDKKQLLMKVSISTNEVALIAASEEMKDQIRERIKQAMEDGESPEGFIEFGNSLLSMKTVPIRFEGEANFPDGIEIVNLCFAKYNFCSDEAEQEIMVDGQKGKLKDEVKEILETYGNG